MVFPPAPPVTHVLGARLTNMLALAKTPRRVLERGNSALGRLPVIAAPTAAVRLLRSIFSLAFWHHLRGNQSLSRWVLAVRRSFAPMKTQVSRLPPKSTAPTPLTHSMHRTCGPADYARFQPGSAAGRGRVRAPRGSRRETRQAGQGDLARDAPARVRHTATGQRDRGGHQEDKLGVLDEETETVTRACPCSFLVFSSLESPF